MSPDFAQELAITISAREVVMGVFDKVRDGVSQITDAFKGMKDGGVSAEGVLKTSFAGIGIAGGIAVGVIAGVSAAILELGARGSDVNDVKDAFAGLTKGVGTDATSAIGALRKGSQGLIDDFTLMKGMNKALSAGFQGTAEDMTVLGSAAHILADRVGYEGGVAGAYGLLTDALATGKGKSLAALGIMVEMKGAAGDLKDALKAQGDEVTTAAQAESNRTEIMKALRTAVLEAGEGELDFSEKVDVAKVGLKNFNDDLASSIAQSPALNSALQSIAGGMIGAFGENQQSAIQTITGYVDQFAIFLVNVAQVAVTGAEYMVGAYRGVQVIFSGLMTVITFLAEGANKAFASILEGATHLPVVGDKFKGMAADAKDLALQTEGMRKSFQEQTSEAITHGGEQMAAFEGVKETLGHLADGMQKASDKGVTHESTVKAITSTSIAAGKAHSDLADDIAKAKKAMGELTEKIELAHTKGLDAKEMLKLFGDAAVKAALEGKAMGVDVTQAVKDIADAYDKQKLSDLVDKESLKIRGLYESIMKDAEEQVKKGLIAQNKAYEGNNRVIATTLDDHLKLLTQLEGDSLANRIEVVKEDTRKRKAALDTHATNYKEALTQIEGYETAAVAATTEAWKTGGFKTRTELEADAAHAKLIFETIKNDGEHTPAQIAEAWKKMVDANNLATGGWADSFHTVMAGIPSLIEGAMTGGGGISGAIKGIGSKLGAQFGEKMFGPTGALASVGNMVPGLGAALGAVAGPLIDVVTGFFKKIFGHAGRDAVEAFAETFAGGFDGPGGLHEKLLTLGAAGEQLWVKLTQGVGKNNPAQAKAVIEEINQALKDSPEAMSAMSYKTIEDLQHIADKAKEVYEYMLASGKYSSSEIAKAFEASKTAQIAAMGETENAQTKSLDTISAKYAESLGKLDSEYKSLAQSVGAEAEEAEMGVIETQQRARMKEIEEERKAQETKRDDELAIVKETFDATVTAAKTADDEVRKIFGRAMKIPIEWSYPDGPPHGGGEGEPQHAVGAYIRQDHTARVHAGEIVGPIDFMSRALAGAMARVGGGAGGGITIHGDINLTGATGQEAAEEFLEYLREKLLTLTPVTGAI